jgi:hypothetical protein
MESQAQSDQDRRTSPRISVAHAAKVFDPRAERYHAAQTCNVSAGGALLKVQRSMPVCSGDRLDVIIDTEAELSRVLALNEFVPARVVRVTAIDRFSQAVAVQFHAATDATAEDDQDPIIHTYVKPQRERIAA